MMKQVETVKGYVDHMIFQNAENGFSVMEMNISGELIRVVGIFPGVTAGEMLSVTGEKVIHPVYGDQIKASAFEILPPEDALAIERYLASGAIKGIGEKRAAQIVKAFGSETFRILEEEPERLAEIKGIGQEMARDIGIQVEEKRDMREAMIFLQNYGVSNNKAMEIFTRYGGGLYDVLKENPYVLARDIRGIGFKTADDIACKMGCERDSKFRIESGVTFVLEESIAEGHIFLPEEELKERTENLLEISLPNMEDCLMEMVIDRKIVVEEKPEGKRIYKSYLYMMELKTAGRLLELSGEIPFDKAVCIEKIEEIGKETGVELGEQQKKAVLSAAGNGLMILTGGPGTGKTTAIKTMIHYFESQGKKVSLAAPTGRAAKRMAEATGKMASTIHRLLEVSGNPEDEAMNFGRNADNPLESDVFIVDEMSMVDLFIMYALLMALPSEARLVLVGDPNQLPSVGPGRILGDLIASEIFPVVELTDIFRQAAESAIVQNAHKIRRGELPDLDAKTKDFYFLEREEADAIIALILVLVRKHMAAYKEGDLMGFQVMSPMKKGLLGVNRMNEVMQEYLNPASKKKAEKKIGERIFREGDKVMQIKNNYQREWEIRTPFGLAVDSGVGVFNGDIGLIREISDYRGDVMVEFDEGRRVIYPFKELEEITLAYAITIHKAQGSEYDAVILPLLKGPDMLYNRNLIYTAITRAKNCVVIAGSRRVVYDMVRNQRENARYTSLKEVLKEVAVLR